jgi:hypothetical protein
MPFLAYIFVVGSALLGLLFVAEHVSGPPEPMRMSSNFEGLPKPFKAPPEQPKPRPVLTAEAAAASASANLDTKKAEASKPTPTPTHAPAAASASKKHVKSAQASNKKKATRIVRAPREPREVYAQSYYDSEFRGFGRFFW